MHNPAHPNRPGRWIAGASALALAAAAALPAAAQDKPAPSGNTVGEVVVTAQFREQSLQQTPIAITAVNAEMLAQRNQNSIDQVAAQAPNVTLKPAGAAFGPSLQAYIRGVGQYDFNYALEPGVGMYVDDVYYSTLTGSIFDLLDVDRVEVLRGPQGTLAGKNSIGGAIKVYSKKPTGDGSGYVEGTYGSYNRIDFRGSADLSIVPDKLFLRLAGVSKHRDGYVDRIDYACSHPGSGLPTFVVGQGCKLGTEGGQSFSALRASLRWLASDKVEVNIIGDYTNDDSEVQPNTLYAARTVPSITLDDGNPATPVVVYGPQFVSPDPFVSYSTFVSPKNSFGAYSIPPVNTLNSWGVSGTVDVALTDKLALKWINAYRSYTSDFAEDTDGSPLNGELVMNHVAHHSLMEELRLNGGLGDVLDYTVGAFYFRQLNKNSNRVDLGYAGLDFMGNDPVLSHNKSAFAHLVWHVVDNLNVTGGLRYTKEDKTYTYSRLSPGTFTPAPVVGPLTGVTGTFEGHRWDWRINADYSFTPDFMVYGQVSTGYKGGGINPRPFVVGQVQPFGPETLTAYEAGFKSMFLERRIRLNGAAFFNNYKDIQLTLLSCPQFSPPIPGFPCALPQNAGDAHVKGFELETQMRPIDGLTIDGALSYIDFKYTRIDPLAGGPTSPRGVQFGMVTPFTPKWKWSVGIQYEIPMGDHGSITPRLDAAFQDDIFTNAVNCGAPPVAAGCTVAATGQFAVDSNRIKGYTLLNGRITYRSADRDWEASLSVTNLTDKTYYLSKFDLFALAGWTSAPVGRPREWAVTVRKNF